jgi:hypothetical protein
MILNGCSALPEQLVGWLGNDLRCGRPVRVHYFYFQSSVVPKFDHGTDGAAEVTLISEAIGDNLDTIVGTEQGHVACLKDQLVEL